MAPVAGRACQARRLVRMHPLRLLLDLLSVLLVESGAVLGPRGAAPSLSLARGFARRGKRRAPRSSRGSLPALSLPHHHELRHCLPEGLEPLAGHRRDQADDGEADALVGVTSADKEPGT